MPSFSVPLSGLDADSQALSSIANNLANMNTVGYKTTTTLFRDTLYQSFGSDGAGDPIQVGLGTSIDTNSANFTQGSADNTGVDTDMEIQGNGFFVLNGSSGQLYSRAGNFTLGPTGTLLASDGSSIMGWQANGGTINTSNPLAPISIVLGQAIPAKASTSIEMPVNLDASAAITAAGGTPTFTTTANVFDTLGGQHTLTFNFTKTASNTWNYEVDLPADDVSGQTAPVAVAAGTLTFNNKGALLAATEGGAAVTGNQINLALPSGDLLADGATLATSTTGGSGLNWSLVDGSGNQVLTQPSGTSSTGNQTVDGYASGTLESFTVDANGVVQGTYSNNQTQAVAQLALASFANVQGLSRVGNDNLQQTQASGNADIGVANVAGRGALQDGVLESSNVDIATEFSNLIMAQRAYEANAKSVTTFDQIYQDTINLKQ